MLRAGGRAGISGASQQPDGNTITVCKNRLIAFAVDQYGFSYYSARRVYLVGTGSPDFPNQSSSSPITIRKCVCVYVLRQ